MRTNSKAALEKILKTIAGDKGIPRLGETTEFKYIRTLMPRGDKREDGLVYLSDPFIRRLVGPELKLTEARRMLCYNHLRMIGHAAMLYRTQFGKAPKSLDELSETGCARVGTRHDPERTCWFAPAAANIRFRRTGSTASARIMAARTN